MMGVHLPKQHAAEASSPEEPGAHCVGVRLDMYGFEAETTESGTEYSIHYPVAMYNVMLRGNIDTQRGENSMQDFIDAVTIAPIRHPNLRLPMVEFQLVNRFQ